MTLSPETVSKLDSLLESFTSGDKPRLPGASISVVTTSSSTSVPTQGYLNSAGRRDLTIPAGQDARGDINPQTLIYIASCTKSFLAVTFLQLISEGVIHGGLDDTQLIKEHIPEILQNGVIDLSTGEISPVTKPLTLRHLLSHTSGSAYPFKDASLMKWAQEHKVPGAFDLSQDAFLKLPLVAQPGDVWTYGYGLDWAALLLQRSSKGKSVEAVLAERIFTPLGMTRTSFSAERLVRQVDGDSTAKSLFESRNGMQIHFRTPEGGLVLCEDPAKQFPRPLGSVFEQGPPSFESGGAGAYSTIEDYSKWLAYLVTLAQASRHHEVLDRLPPSLKVSPELAKEFVTPYLNKAQKVGLELTLSNEGVAEPAGGDYSKLSHTPALAYYEIPSEHGNPPGSLFWSGITNLFYAIDPGSDEQGRNPSAIMACTQILPYRDPHFKDLLHSATRIVFDAT